MLPAQPLPALCETGVEWRSRAWEDGNVAGWGEGPGVPMHCTPLSCRGSGSSRAPSSRAGEAASRAAPRHCQLSAALLSLCPGCPLRVLPRHPCALPTACYTHLPDAPVLLARAPLIVPFTWATEIPCSKSAFKGRNRLRQHSACLHPGRWQEALPGSSLSPKASPPAPAPAPTGGCCSNALIQ